MVSQSHLARTLKRVPFTPRVGTSSTHQTQTLIYSTLHQSPPTALHNTIHHSVSHPNHHSTSLSSQTPNTELKASTLTSSTSSAQSLDAEASHRNSYMVPRPLPYPSTHPNKGLHRPQPGNFFATFPTQNYEILRRIYWKRRGYFMAVNIPPLASIEQVSTSIWRILGGNPSKFTLQGTNTYLLGVGRERILVDTAQGLPEWKRDLQQALSQISNSPSPSQSQSNNTDNKSNNVVISDCILTHWHHDHVMGVPDTRALSPNVRVHKHLSNSYDPDQTLTKEEIHDIADGQRFRVGSAATNDLFEVEAFHCPGHARDHMCLVITASGDAEEVGCIFTADNVLGHGTAVFEDLALYVQSLQVMKDRVGAERGNAKGDVVRRAFPGHGAVIADATAKLNEYIVHRQMREDEAVNVLVYGTTVPPGKAPLKTAPGFPQSQPPPPGEGEVGYAKELVVGREWESMEMVRIIYRMYPENLWGPAEGGLLQVLDKLRKDGRVVRTEGGKWMASEATVAEARREMEELASRSPVKL